MGYESASKMSLTNAAGEPETVNLAAYGDVFGEPTSSPNSKTRAVAMSTDSSGFAGSYDMPESVLAASDQAIADEEAAAVEAGTLSTAQSAINSARRRSRRKLAAQKTIPNPVYCINAGDNFMFTVESCNNYPKY